MDSFQPLEKPAPGRKDSRYQEWIHSQSCCVSGRQPVVMHHVRRDFCGLGLKPDDRFAVPLHEPLHLELHTIGAITFERKYRVDLLALADETWRTYRGEQEPT